MMYCALLVYKVRPPRDSGLKQGFQNPYQIFPQPRFPILYERSLSPNPLARIYRIQPLPCRRRALGKGHSRQNINPLTSSRSACAWSGIYLFDSHNSYVPEIVTLEWYLHMYIHGVMYCKDYVPHYKPNLSAWRNARRTDITCIRSMITPPTIKVKKVFFNRGFEEETLITLLWLGMSQFEYHGL